jgi:hypothetical protein
MNKIPSTGCDKSPYDIRTFAYPTKGKVVAPIKAGVRYSPEDIEHQRNVGICTAISLTQNAKKATGIAFSADYQYLEQKLAEGNWTEGSSIFTALGVAKHIGLLPANEWKWSTEADRDLPYSSYLKKLQSVPKSEIERLRGIASQYQIKAYASVPVTRDAIALAIAESKAGVLARYVIDDAWWTSRAGIITWAKEALQPLRAPKTHGIGHAVTDSNVDGGSFRIANTFSEKWADGGTAYHLFNDYRPTEVWSVWYEDTPTEIIKKLEERKALLGQIKDLLQKVIALLAKR